MKKVLYLAAIVSVFVTSSCKKDKHEHNDEEVLTTLVVKLTPVGGGSALQFQYDDPDGPGGQAPTKQTIALASNKVYDVQLQVLNKTKNPVEDVTPEIVAEGTSHRFYYQLVTGTNIGFSNFNQDANGVSLGTTSRWNVGSAGNGKLNIVLRHYSNSPANKAESDLVNSAKSSSDMDVEFDYTVN